MWNVENILILYACKLYSKFRCIKITYRLKNNTLSEPQDVLKYETNLFAGHWRYRDPQNYFEWCIIYE